MSRVSPPRKTSSTNQQENENAELRKKLNEIENITSVLSEQIKQQKKENGKLKKSSQNNLSELPLTQYNDKSPFTGYDVEYHTDEEDVARETEWILKKKK